ncbi:hypothetical protein pEaSNUABM5_00044 [Erwinia phage pEa_SNUABM_5]|uniref:Uncharacterized protein n=1 Tax=Erwinia phage pEa_SNUABM_5 TaxID=2797313 RepID=A0A7T8EPB6_9CAUD|nr:hypothetical protein MPK73_gp044 [Erwinia phage pEa_SNUABM_5]QQO90186.1 hypothetical protein pEaSNUABM5_00044 [Erwinia phage pEa_SNUABM_5]
MSQDKGIPFIPFKSFEPIERPYGARFSKTSHMRELLVTIGQTEQVFEFSTIEMQRLDAPSLFYSAYDQQGPILIKRIAVLGLKHRVYFERQAGAFAKVRAYWDVVDVYYN